MLEVIALRVVIFLAMLFVLRRALRAVAPARGLVSVLALLAVCSFAAFAGAALVLGESLPSALVESAVIYALIAVIYAARHVAGRPQPPPPP